MKLFHKSLLAAAALLTVGSASSSADVSYVNWQSSDATHVYGVVTFPDSSTVNVTYTGSHLGINLNNNGTYFWTGSHHTGPDVANKPLTTDIITIMGGPGALNHSFTFSSAVDKPVMQLLSLGQPNLPVTYNFDQPFTLENQGSGYWGGGSLTQVGNSIIGNEGHGVIKFDNTSITSINWEAPTAEIWHGFTLGLENPVEAVPEVGTWMSGVGALAAVAFGVKSRRKTA